MAGLGGGAARSGRSADVDLVDICTPGSSHADIAIAALESGKHSLCGKRLANTIASVPRLTHTFVRERSLPAAGGGDTSAERPAP